MGNWISKTWKPGFFSLIQAFIVSFVAAVMITEEHPATIFSSFSALTDKLSESGTLAFVLAGTPMLMMFFWFTRTLWLTVEYLGTIGMIAMMIAVVGLIYMLYLDEDSHDRIKRFITDDWFKTESDKKTKTAVMVNGYSTSPEIRQACQHIACVGVGTSQDKPDLPPTPAMPSLK